jgi:sugar/nucleoside kinase (ribokinase family)
VSITVVGSIAYDSVKTPFGEREQMLGGAATHFALAASFFDQIHPVGPVGGDFAEADFLILRTRGTSTDDVEVRPDGRTFYWRGEYGRDGNTRETLDTRLNVFETFSPKLSPAARASDLLFLANIQPELQAQVLDAVDGPTFTALDSMNLWIDIARDALVSVIERVDCLILNDAELRQLTAKPNLIRAAREILTWGPRVVVAKQGEYGAALITSDGFFAVRPSRSSRSSTQPGPVTHSPGASWATSPKTSPTISPMTSCVGRWSTAPPWRRSTSRRSEPSESRD